MRMWRAAGIVLVVLPCGLDGIQEKQLETVVSTAARTRKFQSEARQGELRMAVSEVVGSMLPWPKQMPEQSSFLNQLNKAKAKSMPTSATVNI